MLSRSFERLKGFGALLFLFLESLEENREDAVGVKFTGVRLPELLALDEARVRPIGEEVLAGSLSESKRSVSRSTLARAASGR